MDTESKNGFLSSLMGGNSKCGLCTRNLDKLNGKVLLCCENRVCSTCCKGEMGRDNLCVVCSNNDIRVKNVLSGSSLNKSEGMLELGASDSNDIPFDLSCWLPQNLTRICNDYHSNQSTSVTSPYCNSTSNSVDSLNNNTLNIGSKSSFTENMNDTIWDENWMNHSNYDSNALLDNFNTNTNNSINGLDIYTNNSLYTWTLSNQLSNDNSSYININDNMNGNSINMDFGKLYLGMDVDYNNNNNGNQINKNDSNNMGNNIKLLNINRNDDNNNVNSINTIHSFDNAINYKCKVSGGKFNDKINGIMPGNTNNITITSDHTDNPNSNNTNRGSVNVINNKDFNNVAFPPLTSASIRQSNSKEIKNGGASVSPSTNPYLKDQSIGFNSSLKQSSYNKLEKSFAEMSLNSSVKLGSLDDSVALDNLRKDINSRPSFGSNSSVSNLKGKNVSNNLTINKDDGIGGVISNSNGIASQDGISTNDGMEGGALLSIDTDSISSTNINANASLNTCTNNRDSKNTTSNFTFTDSVHNSSDDSNNKDGENDDDSLTGTSGEPYNYKRALCRHWVRGYCWLETDCKFAHGEVELRTRDGKLRHTFCDQKMSVTKVSRQKSHSTSCNSSIEYSIVSTPEVVNNSK